MGKWSGLFGGRTWACVTAAVFVVSSSALSYTWSVDCDAGGRIASMLPRMSPGDALLVRGTCSENIEINGETGQFDGITLNGLGAATITGPDPDRDTLRVISVRAITIGGFRIQGGRDGIHLRWTTAVVDGNTIERTGRNGIQLTRESHVHISNNQIRDNPRSGIEVQDSRARIGHSLDEPPQPRPNVIQGNGAHGVVVNRGSVARIAGNVIQTNALDGVLVEKMSQADIASNVIQDNQNGIEVTQNSGVNLGADTGSALEQAPNSGRPNRQYGILASLGAYADGRLGSLSGAAGAKSFTTGANDSLLP